MKRKLLVLALSGAVTQGALAAIDPPTSIKTQQNKVENYYTKASTQKGSKQRANKHLAQIRDTKRKLIAAEKKFVAQSKSAGTSNQYSKYNGIWEITTGAGTARCSNGNSVTMYQNVNRVRWTFSANGSLTMRALETSPVPYRVLESSGNAKASDNRLIVNSYQRLYWSDTGDYTQQNDSFRGTFGSNSYVKGTANFELYSEVYGYTCKGSVTYVGNKVAN